VIDDPCDECRGEGRVERVRQVAVKIPAGVDTGARMRIGGEGEQGRRGGRTGDLYVVFTVAAHERLRREGPHVLDTVDIGYAQAVLGAEVEVETLHGPSELEIPAGTRSGKLFRLKGQGIERLGGRGRGDHVVEVAIRVPKLSELNDEQRALLAKLADLEGRPVRDGKGVLGRVKEFLGG
jgi:molecular chaperone DnaJ